MKSRCFLLAAIFATFLFFTANALNICIPGGTGKLGQAVASKLSQHKVTVLSRNAFLASTPSRVSNDFGWMGQAFLDRNPHVSIRDWDGGDLLDIVGCDWMGWQQDALKPADVVINLVGGYTNQRNMATERIVRESISTNPNALQITVSPTEASLRALSPGMMTVKTKRLLDCEEMVKQNCRNVECLRLNAYEIEKSCQAIVDAVSKVTSAVE
jgi:hypothetical protein